MQKEICFKIDSKSLVLESVLVDYNDIPVYFVCTDAEHNYYTVLCVDIDDEQYVIVETAVEKILKLLMQKITMRDLILSEEKFWEVKAGNTLEEDICMQQDMGLICLEDLPYENSYFKIATKTHQNFLENIRSLLFSQSEEWIKVDTGTTLTSDELDVQITLDNVAVDDFVGIMEVKVNNAVLLTEKKHAGYMDIFSDMGIVPVVYRNNNLKNQTIPTSKSDTIAA